MDNIAFDIDGVLYNWQNHAFTWCENFKNLDIDFSSFWKEWIPQQKPEFLDFLVGILDLYTKTAPVTGAVELLDEYSKKYNIYYITARDKDWLEGITIRYFKKYKFPQIDNLIFTKDKTVPVKLHNIKYFVEDSFYWANMCKKLTNMILIKRPYNEDFHDENIKVINYLEEVKNIIP
jgi:uncharacterized HAD superfamily protein